MPKVRIDRKIQKLETLVKQGFERMDHQLNEGFQRVDRRFDETSGEIGRMVKQGFDHVDDRFERVDSQLGAINRRLSQAVYRAEFIHLESRVSTLERSAKPKK